MMQLPILTIENIKEDLVRKTIYQIEQNFKEQIQQINTKLEFAASQGLYSCNFDSIQIPRILRVYYQFYGYRVYVVKNDVVKIKWI